MLYNQPYIQKNQLQGLLGKNELSILGLLSPKAKPKMLKPPLPPFVKMWAFFGNVLE